MSSEHGCVERAIRALGEGFQMLTPDRICGGTKGSPFKIIGFDPDKVRLLVGAKGSRINLMWHELEGIIPYMRDLGAEIEIRSVMEVAGSPKTLDGYLKQNRKVMRSTYTASLLHYAGVVKVICDEPYRVRLQEKYK